MMEGQRGQTAIVNLDKIRDGTNRAVLAPERLFSGLPSTVTGLTDQM